MTLVDYSDSESGPDEREPPLSTQAVAWKKRKRSDEGENTHLPPLPAAFLDQYSSTVRTSTQDDPVLHGGRKRVTPHVAGNWPTHVYLEWRPRPRDVLLIKDVLAGANPESSDRSQDDTTDEQAIHSLLETDLGVALPLHISLSRPLVLRGEEKERFLTAIQNAIEESDAKAFEVRAKSVVWHPNENATRWFLVLTVCKSEQLQKLLKVCNDVAKLFGQPVLYARSASAPSTDSDGFHISIAWSLGPPRANDKVASPVVESTDLSTESLLVTDHLAGLSQLNITCTQIKVRIGQDVHVLPLKPRRPTRAI